MLGGHLDSWHSATGATDNAIGCAIMMEAARILKAIGASRAARSASRSGAVKNRACSDRGRTSKQHFGSFENRRSRSTPKPEAYWNIDSGTGRVRGAGVFGPPEAAGILASLIKPFEDIGVFGASACSSRAHGGTDSTSSTTRDCRASAQPGPDRIQQPHVAHEPRHLRAHRRDDVKQSAMTIASTVYHLAMRDEMLPRFSYC